MTYAHHITLRDAQAQKLSLKAPTAETENALQANMHVSSLGWHSRDWQKALKQEMAPQIDLV